MMEHTIDYMLVCKVIYIVHAFVQQLALQVPQLSSFSEPCTSQPVCTEASLHLQLEISDTAFKLWQDFGTWDKSAALTECLLPHCVRCMRNQ